MIAPIVDNMSGPAQFALFVLIGTGVVSGLGDAYYTSLNLGIGLTEANPVARWLQKKLGQALAAFVAIVLFILTASFTSVVYPKVAITFAAAITALETFNTFRNRSLYLKYRPKPAPVPVKK